jgi:hypothetical protein
VTVALGITPPEVSVTTPVIPPSVCCASRNELDSAAAATMVNSLGSREEKIRMEYLKSLGLGK